jgi:hypothetical protein
LEGDEALPDILHAFEVILFEDLVEVGIGMHEVDHEVLFDLFNV